MKPSFNYSPSEIQEFIYFDDIDLFMITLKNARNENEIIRYQAEESNTFYVWLKSNSVKEGSTEWAN